MAEPRRNRPRNALLTGIKIYLNGAPHYPAPEARLCDEEGTKRWRRQKRCIATNEEGNLLLLLLVREREREKQGKGKLRNGEEGRSRWWLAVLSLSYAQCNERATRRRADTPRIQIQYRQSGKSAVYRSRYEGEQGGERARRW